MKKINFVLLITFFLFSASKAQDRASSVINEKQHIPDQGNGYYLNPIFPGNYGDPTIVRVKDDYYVAHSRGNGIMVWHSRDLVNWKPLVRHYLPKGFNTVWAIDVQYFNEMFHIYMPIRNYPNKEEGNERFGNFVIRAKNPAGPWSDPIQIEIPDPENGEWMSAIDPGFIQTPEGEKFLYVNHGWAVKLNIEGTKAVTPPKQYYDGWPIPDDWVVECKCLESPKLFYKDEYYYLVSAEGGTSGPSTAHMSVVARAKHPLGPWENSPYNPLHHTYSAEEAFWHQGHGTVFEDKDGNWWTIYHGRVKDYPEMGRPTLLMPIEWTKDGWPVQKNKYLSNSLIPKPSGEDVGHGLPLSDNFSSKNLNPQWSYNDAIKDQLEFGDGFLKMKATGIDSKIATSVSASAPNKSYEISVKLEGLTNGNVAGIRIGDEGILTDGKNVFFADAPTWRQRHSIYPINSKTIWLKIINFRKDISFYYSIDGITWKKFDDSLRINASYNYSLFSDAKGKVVFSDFKYQGLE